MGAVGPVFHPMGGWGINVESLSDFIAIRDSQKTLLGKLGNHQNAEIFAWRSA